MNEPHGWGDLGQVLLRAVVVGIVTATVLAVAVLALRPGSERSARGGAPQHAVELRVTGHRDQKMFPQWRRQRPIPAVCRAVDCGANVVRRVLI